MIKILLVDDSLFVREQLRQLILTQPDCIVVGEARHGRESIDLAARLHPDVIIMDVDMPVMDGIEATRFIMESTPTPILIHTSSYISRSRNVPFAAIQMGALDIIEKPDVYPLSEQEKREFLNRIRLAAQVKVFRRLKPRAEVEHPAAPPPNGTHAVPAILAIAASTGGPKALYDIISALPPFVPFPILVVQHIGASFVAGFVEWLQTTTQIQIKVAQHGEPLVSNVCYVSPGGRHLTVRLPHTIALDDGPPLHSCKPSADILFSSVGAAFGAGAVGILLTGIGEDGAQGLLELKQAGSTTIAQDEESSVVFGMPKKAIELHAATSIGNIQQIVTHIKRLFQLS